MFVQDGDPSQNSKAAKTALDKIGAVQFSIPPRSLDLNPIENTFNLVENKLSTDAVKYSISKESYAKFVEKVENTLLSYLTEPMDNIIKSMPKRISQVIESKGHCLKSLDHHFFMKKSEYRYIMINLLLKYATVYTSCIYTPFLFYWKYLSSSHAFSNILFSV